MLQHWKTEDEGVEVTFEDSSERIDVGDGLFYYDQSWVTVRGGDHNIDIELDVVAGRFAARGVAVVRRDGGPPVTSETMRAIPVARLVSHALIAVQSIDAKNEHGQVAASPALPSPEELEYVARHGLDDTTLRVVARVYRTHYLTGRPPTRAVERVLGVPRSTAGRWVAAAREAGLLTGSRGRGKAGG